MCTCAYMYLCGACSRMPDMPESLACATGSSTLCACCMIARVDADVAGLDMSLPAASAPALPPSATAPPAPAAPSASAASVAAAPVAVAWHALDPRPQTAFARLLPSHNFFEYSVSA